MTKSSNNNCKAVLLTFVKAGLWEKDVRLLMLQDIEWQEVYRLASEQSVLGLVLAGLEHSDVKPPKDLLLQLIGEVQQIEQRNKVMNVFIADIIEKLREEDIYSLLVKGQGIAQCYERPLWRNCGDIDLLLCEDNYKKAIKYLSKIASYSDEEHRYTLHKAFVIAPWEVELHGTLRSKLGRRIDSVIDEVQNEVFCGGVIRSWTNGSTQVYIPSADEDVIFVFVHILQHFFNGGIGLRQVCDWCRLLWSFNGKIRRDLLETRIRRMGIMSEWKTFAALAVGHLGMPVEAIPFYSHSSRWENKANMVLSYIFETGNMGHNRDVSYRDNLSKAGRKIITLYRVTHDSIRHMFIFPKDAFRAWWRIMVKGIKDSL